MRLIRMIKVTNDQFFSRGDVVVFETPSAIIFSEVINTQGNDLVVLSHDCYGNKNCFYWDRKDLIKLGAMIFLKENLLSFINHLSRVKYNTAEVKEFIRIVEAKKVSY